MEQFAPLKRDFLQATPIPPSDGLAQELAAVQAGRLPYENLATFLERIDRASEGLSLTREEGAQARALYGRREKGESSGVLKQRESISDALPQDRTKMVLDRAHDMIVRLGRSAEPEAPSMEVARVARGAIDYEPGLVKAHPPPPPLIQSRNVEPETILPPLQQNPSLQQKCKHVHVGMIFDEPWVERYECADEPGVEYKTVPGAPFLMDGLPHNMGEGSSAAVDVSQGQLGDCYYLAPLAAIANKYPDKIREMIRRNKDGTFSVTFYHRRWPWEIWKPEFERVEVRVDGKFPMGKWGPAYANYGRGRLPDLHEIWPMVAEKAYASYWGSYDKIGQGGFPGQALEEITGRPSERYMASSVSSDLLASWDAMGRAIVVSTKWGLPWPLSSLQGGSIWEEPLYKDRHLVPMHVYWVESVDKERKTVTLANPWGWEREHLLLTEEEFRRVIDRVYVNPVR